MTETATKQDPARYALAQLAGKSYDKPTDVTHALTQLSEHFVIVAPGGTTQCAVVAEGYKALVTSVVPYAPPDDKSKGDVFKDRRTGTWCFHADFLKKLAAGVGIEWTDEERIDNFSHPFVCAIKVKGRYRDWSGEYRQVIGSHMLDLRDEAEHGIDKPNQLKAMRGTIHQICATKAKSRAIADACVKRTIDERDLGRPIICAKLYRTEAVDATEARAALYGGGEAIDDSTGEVMKTADATVSDPDSSAQGKAATPSPSSGAAAPTAPASPASERPATSFACKVSEKYPVEALRGKCYADLTDEQLSSYVDWAVNRANVEGPTWTQKGRDGAKKAIDAAYADVDWRMGQKGSGPQGNGGEW